MPPRFFPLSFSRPVLARVRRLVPPGSVAIVTIAFPFLLGVSNHDPRSNLRVPSVESTSMQVFFSHLLSS